MRIGIATNVGLQRDHNEDAYWYSDRLFVVCDGMGGHQAGEVASKLAIETFQNYSFSSQDPLNDVSNAINEAHRTIKAEAETPEYDGMGTTATLALILFIEESYQLYLGHVGDSRAYLLRKGQLSQLTSDHSIIGELLRNGSLTEDEATHHPHRHVVTQALGIGEVKIETFNQKLASGDKMLLCTDGLTDVVNDSTLLSTLAQNSPQEAADKLVDIANCEGGPDNITVIVVEIP